MECGAGGICLTDSGILGRVLYPVYTYIYIYIYLRSGLRGSERNEALPFQTTQPNSTTVVLELHDGLKTC